MKAEYKVLFSVVLLCFAAVGYIFLTDFIFLLLNAKSDLKLALGVVALFAEMASIFISVAFWKDKFAEYLKEIEEEKNKEEEKHEN